VPNISGEPLTTASAGTDQVIVNRADNTQQTGFKTYRQVVTNLYVARRSGRQTTDIGSTTDQINAIAFQADGIIAAGQSGNQVSVGRYNVDGILDSTFGTQDAMPGCIELNFQAGGQDLSNGCAVQSDGKIVCSGYSILGGVFKIGVLRLLADGSALDTTFGTNGTVVTTAGSGLSLGIGMALQTDGKILVVGTGNSNTDAALLRYTTAGALDTTFNSTGVVLTDFGGADSFNWVTIQGDGKIICGGKTDSGGVLARYTTAGALDTGFNTTGKITITSAGFTNISIKAVLIQSDGKVLACGSMVKVSDNSIWAIVCRFTTAGAVDSSYGISGQAIISVTPTTSFIGAALTAEGKVILLGQNSVSSSPATTVFTATRLFTNGTLDQTFGSAGSTLVSFNGNNYPGAILVQPDGKIVLAGWVDVGVGSVNTDWAITRLDKYGFLDRTFGAFA
jgi:uncharacterized delta-60 repeat protein